MVNLKELRAITLVLTAGALWGSVFPLTKIALQDLSVSDIAFYRAILASLVLIIFSSRKLSKIKLRRGDAKRILPISLCGVVAFWTLLNLG